MIQLGLEAKNAADIAVEVLPKGSGDAAAQRAFFKKLGLSDKDRYFYQKLSVSEFELGNVQSKAASNSHQHCMPGTVSHSSGSAVAPTPSEDSLAFLAIHADKHHFKECGKDKPGILYRIDNGSWTFLEGPVLYVDKPGQQLKAADIVFIARDEMVAWQGYPDERTLKIFVNYGTTMSPVDEKFDQYQQQELVGASSN